MLRPAPIAIMGLPVSPQGLARIKQPGGELQILLHSWALTLAMPVTRYDYVQDKCASSAKSLEARESPPWHAKITRIPGFAVWSVHAFTSVRNRLLR